MNIIEYVKRLILQPNALTIDATNTLLKGVTGRGNDQYAEKLSRWIGSNQTNFPEQIHAQCIDNINDRGIDVLVEGLSSKTRIGFQIKSDNDLKQKNFTQKLKAQLTDAQGWGVSQIFIFFCCSVKKINTDKYLYIQNDIHRWPNCAVMIIEPQRAAALFSIFTREIPNLVFSHASWQDLFISCGRENLSRLYLDSWPNIEPQNRFAEPNNYYSIVESVKNKPLTILTGPPAIGKTYIALNILWNSNRKTKWITAADYLPSISDYENNYETITIGNKIAHLIRYLGITPPNPPVDSQEFVAANLLPDSLVFIEDPFGKTDPDFNISLSTYSFFDLNHFITSILENTPRYGCNIILTTREGLFEKWQKETQNSSKILENANIFKINSNSYEKARLSLLAEKLLEQKGYSGSSNLAIRITNILDNPFQIESLLRNIEGTETDSDIIDKTNKLHQILSKSIEKQLIADSESEKLFLLLLDLLSTNWHGRNDFRRAFLLFFNLLKIKGSAETALQNAMSKYRIHFSREDNSFRLSGKDFNLIHLETSHSSVNDAIIAFLQAKCQKWIKNICRKITILNASDETSYYIKLICFKLILLVDEKENENVITLIKTIFQNKFDFQDTFQIFSVWLSHSILIKDAIIKEYISLSPDDFTFINFCGMLDSFKIDERYIWQIYKHLLTAKYKGANHFLFSRSPWNYAIDHIDSCPSEIYNKLEELLRTDPKLFYLSIGPSILLNWEKVPDEWKKALFTESCISNQNIQHKILATIVSNWETIPGIFKEYFKNQFSNKNDDIKFEVTVAAWVCYSEMNGIFRNEIISVINDPNPIISLRALYESIGEEEHDIEFANMILNRCSDVAAAIILRILLEKRFNQNVENFNKLKQEAFAKGGIFSKAVLLYSLYSEDRNISDFAYYPNKNIFKLKRIEQLALIWAYINTSGKKPNIAEDELTRLISCLNGKHRYIALWYLSIMLNNLPLKTNLYTLYNKTQKDHEAISKGEKERKDKFENTRRYFVFPLEYFLKESKK